MSDPASEVRSPGLVYRSAAVYETVMRLLYGRHYGARQRAIASLIPEGSSLLEVCCGPGTLYRRHLAAKNVRYLGLDINPRFLRHVRRAGGEAREWDVRGTTQLPPAEYVLMQASLYHFMDDPRALIERMVAAATQQVILAEPVHNVAKHPGPAGGLAARLTDPGTGPQHHRFDEPALDEVFQPFAPLVRDRRLLPGGREKLYVLDAAPAVVR
jgi:SAM-dependent methyltransferase